MRTYYTLTRMHEMNNDGRYIYYDHPYPFSVAVVRVGIYVAGQYYSIEADQFSSRFACDAYTLLLFSNKDPEGHICETCGITCKNLKVTGHCCMWVPIPGMVSGRWG